MLSVTVRESLMNFDQQVFRITLGDDHSDILVSVVLSQVMM